MAAPLPAPQRARLYLGRTDHLPQPAHPPLRPRMAPHRHLPRSRAPHPHPMGTRLPNPRQPPAYPQNRCPANLLSPREKEDRGVRRQQTALTPLIPLSQYWEEGEDLLRNIKKSLGVRNMLHKKTGETHPLIPSQEGSQDRNSPLERGLRGVLPLSLSRPEEVALIRNCTMFLTPTKH